MILSELNNLMKAAFPPLQDSETALKPWVRTLFYTSSHLVAHVPPQPVSLHDYLKERKCPDAPLDFLKLFQFVCSINECILSLPVIS